MTTIELMTIQAVQINDEKKRPSLVKSRTTVLTHCGDESQNGARAARPYRSEDLSVVKLNSLHELSIT